MKTLCIAGAHQPDLDLVADLLQSAGLACAKPSMRDETTDIANWHEQVLSAANEDSEVQQAIENPGRLWEQIAGDLFLANGKTKLWGWADSRSTWLLDYWLAFEPRLNFILVCSSPHHMLAGELAGESEIESIESVMGAWERHHQELLRFHHRNPQRSLLVDASECIEHPHALVGLCAERWNLPLALPAEVKPTPETADSLALYLAQQLCQNQRQTEGLQHELAATVTRLGEARRNPEPGAIPYAKIVSDYRKLQAHSTELEKVRSTQGEIAVLKSRLEESVERHQQDQNTAEKKLNDLSKENEFLLLQLHQVQEELETTFLKNEAAQNQVEALQHQIATLSQAKDEQGKLATDYQAQIETLSRERVVLAEARDEQARLTGEQESRVTVLLNDLNASEQTSVAHLARLKELEQENELLLLQLHQVQEELEHYFLQHQELQKKLKEADAQWDRMLRRNPEYCDFESIEVAENAARKGGGTRWKLKGITISGRRFPELEFETIIENGVAGFIFSRQSSVTGPLMRWPVAVENQDEITLIPIAEPANAEQRAASLRELAASDWALLKTLGKLLASNLANPSGLKLPPSLHAETMQACLTAFLQRLDLFSATLRYDRVSLKREQVNPDYEHLWLAFENLAFGAKCWPQFEFRLSCANVRPQHFGTHPKLEFPEEGGQAPFESWFIEAYDDHGAKLELRFALPEAMDLAVWNQLSEPDQYFLSALIDCLPATLNTLQSTKVQLKRPWDDWVSMTRGMQRIVSLRMAQPVAKPEQPAVAATPAIKPLQPKIKATATKTPKAKTEKPIHSRKLRKA